MIVFAADEEKCLFLLVCMILGTDIHQVVSKYFRKRFFQCDI